MVLRVVKYIIVFIFLAESLFAVLPVRVGERMIYDLHIKAEGPISVSGHVGTLDVMVVERTNVKGRDSFHCRTIAESLEWVDTIYPLRDVFDVWFDSETFEPIMVRKQVKEGTWSNFSYIDFNFEEGYGSYTDKRLTNAIYALPKTNAYDIVTFIYYLRYKSWDTGEERLMHWAANRHYRDVYVSFKDGGKKRINILNKWKEIDIVDMTGWGKYNKQKVSITAQMARDYDYVPVYASIPAFQTYGHTITVSGILREYYKNYRDAPPDTQETEGIWEAVGSYVDLLQDMFFRRR